LSCPALPLKRIEVRKLLKGDCVRHLEAKSEIVWNLIDQALEILPAWKIIIGGIHANAFENVGVFTQAVALKSRFGKFAPELVPSRGVKLPQPSCEETGHRLAPESSGEKFRVAKFLSSCDSNGGVAAGFSPPLNSQDRFTLNPAVESA